MADEAVKRAVVQALQRAAYFQPLIQWHRRPVVQGASLCAVRHQLGLDYTLTSLGKALRSLHNAGVIRCARPREGRDEPRPYALYLRG